MLCASCHSEIVTVEVRGSGWGGAALSVLVRDQPRRSYPIGTVSRCPVHGFGFPINPTYISDYLVLASVESRQPPQRHIYIWERGCIG